MVRHTGLRIAFGVGLNYPIPMFIGKQVVPPIEYLMLDSGKLNINKLG